MAAGDGERVSFLSDTTSILMRCCILIGILSVSPEGYMYLERILMYLKCILNDGERKSYMYVVSCHFACISTCIPKKSQNTFEIHVRYIMIHLTCILGASLVSPHGYISGYIRIHQDPCVSRGLFITIHHDTPRYKITLHIYHM